MTVFHLSEESKIATCMINWDVVYVKRDSGSLKGNALSFLSAAINSLSMNSISAKSYLSAVRQSTLRTTVAASVCQTINSSIEPASQSLPKTGFLWMQKESASFVRTGTFLLDLYVKRYLHGVEITIREAVVSLARYHILQLCREDVWTLFAFRVKEINV